jgi:hypothetical protein
MINHHNAEPLATVRTNPERVISERLRAIDVESFATELQHIARHLYFSTPRAPEKDREFLQEIARAEQRVQMKQLQRLMAIASQSTRPEHRMALVDLVRRHCDTQRVCLDVVIASDVETEAQGPGDVDIRQFERVRTRATKERALASLRRHFAALRALIDSVESCPV